MIRTGGFGGNRAIIIIQPRLQKKKNKKKKAGIICSLASQGCNKTERLRARADYG